jgi:hypothetical protein
MPVLLLTLLAASALATRPADAATSTVWKCAGNSGDVVYQDTPCPAGKELRDFSIDPPTLSVVPGTAVPGAKPPPAPNARAKNVATSDRRKTSGGNAGERKFIRAGMSEAEVVQRIGKPDVSARNQRGQGERWSYLPKAGDPDTITTVTLSGGKVSDVERKTVR